MARYRRDGRTDGQTAFQLYIVDDKLSVIAQEGNTLDKAQTIQINVLDILWLHF